MDNFLAHRTIKSTDSQVLDHSNQSNDSPLESNSSDNSLRKTVFWPVMVGSLVIGGAGGFYLGMQAELDLFNNKQQELPVENKTDDTNTTSLSDISKKVITLDSTLKQLSNREQFFTSIDSTTDSNNYFIALNKITNYCDGTSDTTTIDTKILDRILPANVVPNVEKYQAEIKQLNKRLGIANNKIASYKRASKKYHSQANQWEQKYDSLKKGLVPYKPRKDLSADTSKMTCDTCTGIIGGHAVSKSELRKR